MSVTRYKCFECPFTSKHDFTFNSYLKKDHQNMLSKTFNCLNKTEEYRCEICDYKTQLQVALFHHCKQNHATETQLLNVLGVIDHKYAEPQFYVEPTITKVYTEFKCLLCGLATFSKVFCFKHLENCEYETKKKCTKNQILSIKVKWFECCKCNYKTTEKGKLRRHQINVHTPNDKIKWLKCSDCDFKTKFSANLKQHHINIHAADSEIPWFECIECGYKTKRNSHLKQHQLNKHALDTEIKWFECLDCTYKTKRTAHLKLHQINKHALNIKIKWFQCSDCSYKTKENSKLKRHCNYKHCDTTNVNNVEIKWFECNDCSYKTKYSQHLRRHCDKKHTLNNLSKQLKCSQCDFQTKNLTEMKKHSFSGVIKWFECTSCGYKTKRKRDLKQHQIRRDCLGETEWFQCCQCGYKAKHDRCLKLHQTAVHSFSQNGRCSYMKPIAILEATTNC